MAFVKEIRDLFDVLGVKDLFFQSNVNQTASNMGVQAYPANNYVFSKFSNLEVVSEEKDKSSLLRIIFIEYHSNGIGMFTIRSWKM